MIAYLSIDIKRRARRAAGTLAGLLLALAVAVPPAAAQQIVFAPLSDLVSPNGFPGEVDFQQLFLPPAQWANGAARTNAFLFARRYVAATSTDTLRTQFAFLHSVGIPVAIVMGVVMSTNNCGVGVEGMVFDPMANTNVANKLLQAGADVRYMVADEPLTYGHYSKKAHPGGTAPCQYSIDQVAASFATEFRKVQAVFPGLKAIDTEASTRMGYLPDVAYWAHALRANLGPNVSIAINADVQWQALTNRLWGTWTNWTVPWIKTLLAQGVDYGYVVHGLGGLGKTMTDALWVSGALTFSHNWEVSAPPSLVPPPAYVFIQSWNKNPTHALPETNPTTMSSMILSYCRQSAWIAACNRLH